MIAGLNLGRRLELVERFVGHPLYDYQVEYVIVHNDPSNSLDIHNKARQTGLSTVAVADLAVEALAAPDSVEPYLGILISTKQEKANRLLRRLKACYRRVGREFFRQIVAKQNESELVLTTGANIIALSGSPRDPRSETADAAILDEFAFVEEQAELLTAVSPALARRGRMTIISTPNGPGDVFHEYYTSPEKYDARVYTVPWQRCPDLTPAFLAIERERLRALGKSFEQEYECEFVQTIASLFTWDLLKTAEVDEAVTTTGKCVIGFDPARDRDSSGVVVLRIDANGHKEVVAVFDLRGVKYDDQVRRVKSIAADWSVSTIHVDAYAQGDPVADFLGRGGVAREKLSRDDNRAAAAYIKYELERGKFTISPTVALRRTLLKHLHGFDNEKGQFPYQEHTGHADLGSALFLAWQSVPRKEQRAARNVSREIRRRGGARPGEPWYSAAR